MAFMCSNLVTEVSNEHYIGYVLNSNEYFYNTAYQIIRKDNNEGLLRGYKLNYNGRIKIIYDVSKCVSFQNNISSLDSEAVMKIIGNLLVTIINIQANGFVQAETIDIDIRKIFIDTDNMQIKLICVPILIDSQWNTRQDFEAKVKYIAAVVMLNSGSVNSAEGLRLYNDLNDVQISLNQLYQNMITGVYGQILLQTGMEFEYKLNESGIRYIRLVSSDSERYGDVLINKSDFIIGKRENIADLILNSSEVSRIHCEFYYNKEGWYLKDKNSTNGTWINDVRLKSGQSLPVKNGDKIRIGEYIYYVEE